MLTPRTVAAIAAVLGVLVAGCGETTTTKTTTTQATTAAAKPATKLTIRTPRDEQTLHRGRITVAGTTSPGANVTVDNHPAKVAADGRWHVERKLALGDSVMVVEATSPGADPTTHSLSLTRERTAAEKRALAAARERRRAAAAARRKARRAHAEANFKASATSLPYKVLNKDADAQKGKKVVFRGQVFQIQQSGDAGGIMLLAVTDEGYGIWDDNVWVDYDHATSANEDDIVTVYGTITGTKSYDTQIGGTTYVPRMHARYIEVG